MDGIIDAGSGAGAALTLEIERRFAAPVGLVFAAWTEPRHLRRWSAPHGFELTESEGDLRPGGAWRATMREPDGSLHRLSGDYREVEPPRRLVFTHAWVDAEGRRGPETLVTVHFEAVEGGTLMRFSQTGFETVWSRDGHGGGWTECFERLDDLLAAVDQEGA
jgi:uncharacterized protein YndB with AHSA1/START domain